MNAVRQRGMVLFVSLVVLVAMSMAGIAIMRSVDTGNVISGNLAFKSSILGAADMGVENARTWLTTTTQNLANNNETIGYYANWGDASGEFDALGVSGSPHNWSNATSATDAQGNTVRYVVHRMCSVSGVTANSSQCTMTSGTGSTDKSSFGSIDYSRTKFGEGTNVFYRITVRVDGPRRTVGYVQAMVY
jgi:Tfp pilus assembly protein PilX